MTDKSYSTGWTFAQIPIWLLCSNEISSGAKDLFGYLKYRQGTDAACWPSKQTIAFDMGVGEATVTRRMRELTKTGYVKKHPRSGKSNLYELIADPGGKQAWWFEREAERQAARKAQFAPPPMSDTPVKANTPPHYTGDTSPPPMSDTHDKSQERQKTTDKKTSGKKMPDQTPSPNPITPPTQTITQTITQSTSPDKTLPIREYPNPIQEAVAPTPPESLTTRTAPAPHPCPGCTFKLTGPCDPEKCDCACHQGQGETGDPFWVEPPPPDAQFVYGEAPPSEGVVDKSGVPVSDATRAALRDVMEAPVGLPDDPCDEQFTELVNVLDSALASDDVSDMVKGIFRDARDKLTPVGKSGVAGPLPDDDPRYEVPFQDAGGRAGSAVVNNLVSGMASAILPLASVAISAPVELTKKEIAALAFDLEAYFCEIAGLKTPNRSTAYFAKKAHVRWGNPCKEMMRLADYDLAKAKRLMDAAWVNVVKDGWEGKISTAQSIENYFGAQARGPGKAVEMPSGPLGLTKAQQKVSLFGQNRNGGK